MNNRNSWFPFTNSITVALAALANSVRAVKDIGDNTATTNSLFLDISHFDEEFLELRFYGEAADADSNVVNLYAARGENDDYILVATLTLTTGTMIVRGGTERYVDTIALTTELDEGFEVVVTGGADNEVGKAWLNTNGHSRFLVIATTLNSTSLRCEAAPVKRMEIPTV